MTSGAVTAPEQVVHDFLQVFSSGDFEGAAARLSDDVVWRMNAVDLIPREPTFVGKPAVVNELFALVGVAFDPATFKVDYKRTIAAGNDVVATWELSAKTADGRDYKNAYCVIFTVTDGVVSHVEEYLDSGYAKRVLFA